MTSIDTKQNANDAQIRNYKIGFFWDLENCRFSVTKSALDVVRLLRSKFEAYGTEVQFDVVCDVTKVFKGETSDETIDTAGTP